MKRIPEQTLHHSEVSIDETDDLGKIAIFFDFENIALGIEGKFDVTRVISTFTDRGDVLIRRAYADWGAYRKAQLGFLEEGVTMVFLPSYGFGDKNRTDTAICVDAMEILFTRPYIDTFVIASGDSDFGVLARRLRDHGKRVVGLSAKKAASKILVRICHEFIFYETLVGERLSEYSEDEGATRIRAVLSDLVDIHGRAFKASVLKDRMRKVDPTFSEKNYGASSFTKFLRRYPALLSVKDGGHITVSG